MSDTPTLEELERQERELQFDRFDFDTAWRLGLALVDAGRARELPIAIDIRRAGQQLFHAALPGSAPDNDAWLRRKTRVVERFHKASFHVGERARQEGMTFEEQMRLAPDQYAAHGGAFPITVRGVGVVGTVAVSGLPQLEDHELVVAVLTEVLGETV